MPNKNVYIEVKFTEQFKRDIHRLAKKYRHIKSDIKTIIEQLQSGKLIGVRIPKTNEIIYKVRLKNSDIKKGKSGGYRLIYHVQDSIIVIMMTLYAKSEQEDISVGKIQYILRDFIKNNE